MSINSLPPELVQVIFERLYYRPEEWTREPDYATLAACSLTQRSWHLPAQRLLFRHIPIRVRPICLFDDIRILDMVLMPESIPDLAFLLAHCTRLYELGLTAQCVFSLPPSVPAANIRALRLVECSVESPVLYALLALFPAVRFLTIGTEIVAPPPPTAAPAPALYELALKRSLRADILTWILANSVGSLRILELTDPPSADMRDVLGPHGPYIHSLRIFRFSNTAASILRSCVNLKEFVLSSLPVMGPPLVKLPESIKHFSLANTLATPTDWSPFMSLIALLSLKTFTCDKGSRSQPGFDGIEQLCRLRHVALFADMSKWWPNEDPIVVSSFPRGRSTDHFSLMN
ncbi:hypothetical protein IW261DRAFT_631622 [Armillaria novae-zelandiae]|uniref:F-box domain-containing protein n=1 Tax=Armillaria novae-zelandiae TaxID=153914 RepID=A0AA39PPI8_9AGAR|nr:hypothetical protein IW261DRAFT_631622 [Armillaria novae-zelandiae]